MRTVVSLFTLGLVVVLSSCASTYRSIDPPTVEYDQLSATDTFAYKFDVLKEVSDTKLSRKEQKSDIKIVAIRITNTTGKTLLYGVNYKLYAGASELHLIEPDSAEAIIHATVPTYLLYLLLTPLTITSSHGATVSKFPIGLILGPGLALGNMTAAGIGNKKFRRELEENDIVDRPIKNGETFYGLIAIPDPGLVSALTIKIY